MIVSTFIQFPMSMDFKTAITVPIPPFSTQCSTERIPY